jgi:spermidine synthase
VGDKYFYIIEKGSKKIFKSGGRFSSSSGTIYSIIDTQSIFTGSYPDLFLPLPGLYHNPKVLVIGMGGGTIPYQLAEKYKGKASIDVVEADKGMVRIPRLFLGKHKRRWRVHIGDGLEFVQKTGNKYDIIMLDAYNEDAMPSEFISHEFVEAAHSSLTRAGILAINLTTKVSIDHYSGLMRKCFSVYIYPSELGNSFVIGSKHFGIDAIKNEAKRLSAQNGAEYLANVYRELKQA